MTRKRASLSAVLGSDTANAETGEPVPVATVPALAQRNGREGQGRRPGIKQQTAYLPEPVYEQLRRLAFDERRKMHDYLIEGLDRVFQDRGLSPISELLSGGEG